MATFRRAEAADVAAVAALIDVAYAPWVPVLGGRRPRPMLDDHAARIARGENWLVEEAGLLVGVVAIEPKSDALHLFSIAIHPEAQGKGLLRQVFAHAEAEARRLGLRRLTLYTNMLMAANRAIYRHLGFAEIGVEQASGYEIVYMERVVPAA